MEQHEKRVRCGVRRVRMSPQAVRGEVTCGRIISAQSVKNGNGKAEIKCSHRLGN